MSDPVVIAGYLLFAYLLGSVPFGLYFARWVRGIDIRSLGSGNTGATNVWRECGWQVGLPVFLFDVVKGIVPTVAAHVHFGHGGSWVPVLAGLCALVGHNVSPFLKFKGGKGVATSLGVAIGLSWQAGLIAFAVWILIVLVSRYISLGSVIAVPAGAVAIWYFNGEHLPYALFGLLASVFVIVKHRSNFARLRAGTEMRVVLPHERKSQASPQAQATDR
jgi:glycerol-3-phosphate acyltransferase PlsY